MGRHPQLQLLIDNIDSVVDMDQEEKNSWAAEAKFLKAYYHFLLAIHYGPIPIVDSNLPYRFFR